MNSELDFVTGGLIVCIGVVLSSLHVLTGASRGHWQTLPIYLRFPLALAGGLCVWRGVDMITLGVYDVADAAGRANAVSFLAAFGVFVTVTAFLAYVISNTFPIEMWDRLRFMESNLKAAERRKEVPVLMAKTDVTAALDAAGYKVFPPPEEPEIAPALRQPRKSATL